MLTFQSRFGLGKWLEPATVTTVEELARKGVKRLAVIHAQNEAVLAFDAASRLVRFGPCAWS